MEKPKDRTTTSEMQGQLPEGILEELAREGAPLCQGTRVLENIGLNNCVRRLRLLTLPCRALAEASARLSR